MVNTATFQSRKKGDMLMLIKIAKQFGIDVKYNSMQERDYPLDEYDYKLASRHPEKEYKEYKDLTDFDEILKECGLTRADV